MHEYSKNNLLKNIAYLMKIKNVKIGELEEAAKVSAGYLSRLRQNSADNAAPGLDTLILMADKLGVTITTLLYCDFNSLTDTEGYIQKFLTKLINETTKLNGFEWEKETASAVLSDIRHPLCIQQDLNFYRDKQTSYNSLFTDSECALAGPVFKLTNKNKTLYIAHILINLSNQSKDDSYELYLYMNNKLNKICNSNHEGKDEIKALLTSLYEAAEATSHNLKIDDNVKECIDEFLDDDTSDIDDIPF